MNIESLLDKINLFKELVIESGFKRDVIDYKQSISQVQNQNLVFMKGLSDSIKHNLICFENNSLHSELTNVLRENEPFTALNTLQELQELDSNMEIDGQQYFKQLNVILSKLQNAIQLDESELENVRTTFEKYVSDDEEYETNEEQAIMSLIFRDLQTTGSLKEFSKVLHRWNRTLLLYHTLLKSESPKEISLVEIQNGSIDVIFNIDFDIAIDLTELIKIGLTAYGGYLAYKSKIAKEIIASYMGSKKLIALEKEREELMLGNIKDSIKTKALEQHKESLKSDSPPSKTGATKKAGEIANIVTDHIIKGNEVKLLTPPEPEEENEPNLSTELRMKTATVRERWKKLDKKEQQLLLDRYTIRDKYEYEE